MSFCELIIRYDAEYCNTERPYADCRYAGCRGAVCYDADFRLKKKILLKNGQTKLKGCQVQ